MDEFWRRDLLSMTAEVPVMPIMGPVWTGLA